jgi:ZIP family zinc transporter
MLSALGWGLFAGSALLVGALIGWYADPRPKVIGSVMAFGSGVLIPAIAFDLMDDATATGGIIASAVGFLAGAAFFTMGAMLLARFGARRGSRQGAAAATIALGATFDGIPESIIVGLSLVEGPGVSLPIVIAIFLSNVPEGMSSAAGLKSAGFSRMAVFGLWCGIALLCGAGALAGYTLFDGTPPEYAAVAQGVAAGAMLAMIADTMIPEAFDEEQTATGLIMALGFIVAFVLSHGME